MLFTRTFIQFMAIEGEMIRDHGYDITLVQRLIFYREDRECDRGTYTVDMKKGR